MNDEEDVADVIAAVQVNDFEVISDAIDKKLVTADCADADGCTFLHWAAINNRLAICCLLIDQGASVNAVGGVLQETPLAWAVRKKNYGIVQFLLTRGANINHKNIQQKGVLHIACSIGDADMLFLLLHYNADPNVTDTHGDNLLLWLVRKQIHSDVMLTNVKLLMHFGIDLYAADSEGNTLLHLLLLAMGKRKNILDTPVPSPSTTNLAKAKDLLTKSMQKSSLDAEEYVQDEIQKQVLVCVLTEKAGMDAFCHCKNFIDQTPYSLIQQFQDPALLKCYWDMHMYHAVPFYFPSLAAALLLWTLLFFVQVIFPFSPILCVLACGCVTILCQMTCFQMSLLKHNHRYQVGITFGLIVAMYFSFLLYIESYLVYQDLWRGVTRLTLCVVLLVTTLAHRTTPDHLSSCRQLRDQSRQAQHQQQLQRSSNSHTQQDEEKGSGSFGNSTDTLLSAQAQLPASSPLRHPESWGREAMDDLVVYQLVHRLPITGTDDFRCSSTSAAALTCSSSSSAACSPSNRAHPHQQRNKNIYLSHSGTRNIEINIHTNAVNCDDLNSAAGGLTLTAKPQQSSAAYSLCPVCLTNKGKASTHCNRCSCCVQGLDHHCSFLNQCVGGGNRRLFVIFLCVACVSCLLHFCLACAVQSRYYCDHAGDSTAQLMPTAHLHSVPKIETVGGADESATNLSSEYYDKSSASTVMGLFELQYCVLKQEPAFFLITWISFVVCAVVTAMIFSQFYLLARETSTFYMMKGLYHQQEVSYSRGFNNIVHFLKTGKFAITLPDNCDSVADQLTSRQSQAGGDTISSAISRFSNILIKKDDTSGKYSIERSGSSSSLGSRHAKQGEDSPNNGSRPNSGRKKKGAGLRSYSSNSLSV